MTDKTVPVGANEGGYTSDSFEVKQQVICADYYHCDSFVDNDRRVCSLGTNYNYNNGDRMGLKVFAPTKACQSNAVDIS